MNAISSLNQSSLNYFSNAINEVLNGFPVDYETALGVNREELSHLFKKIRSMRTESSPLTQPLSAEDARLLLRCSQFCLEEIDDNEFDTRLGETSEVARKMNQALSQHYV
jgi:hypothetical protein